MDFSAYTLQQFSQELSSSSPVPGGGGASAFVGALAASLASMVGNLTVGKKKYEQYEAEILDAMKEMEQFRLRLLALMDEDAKGFAPLQKAYAIPRDDPQREDVLENALERACEAPREMLRSLESISTLLSVFAEKGSRLAVSDAGVAAACCAAAAKGAGLNVLINAGMMKNTGYAQTLREETLASMSRCTAVCEKVYQHVLNVIF